MPVKGERPELSEKRTKRKVRRKIVGAAVAMTAAVSVLVAGLFSGPTEILLDPDSGKPSIVYQIDEADEVEEDSETDEEDKKKKGLFSRIKAFIMGLPTVVKCILVLPLWALGFLITQLAKHLLKFILTPLLTALLTWLFTAFILLLVFFILCRLIFPEMKAREILSKQNVLIIYGAAAVCCVLNLVLEKTVEEFAEYEYLYRFLEGLVTELGMLIKTALQRAKRRKPLPERQTA